jgi:hypothetical protein
LVVAGNKSLAGRAKRTPPFLCTHCRSNVASFVVLMNDPNRPCGHPFLEIAMKTRLTLLATPLTAMVAIASFPLNVHAEDGKRSAITPGLVGKLG